MLILCNVGSRDVKRAGRELREARTDGEEILRLLEAGSAEVAEELSFEIIEPCVERVLQRHPSAAVRLVLIGTDQDDPQHGRYDTLYFARIIGQLLPGRLHGALSAEVRTIRGANPALYDEAFEAMRGLLAGVCRELPEGGVERCFGLLAGGTPACNAALLLHGVRLFGDRFEALYKPRDGAPRLLRAGEQVIGAFREQVILDALGRKDFRAAERHLRELEPPPRALAALAAFAARRLDFDFKRALEALDEAEREGDAWTRGFLDRSGLRDGLLGLLEPEGAGSERLRALVGELFWNARITFEQGRYADFLARVYRFQEAVYRVLVEEIFGLPTDRGPEVRRENERRWEEGIRANPALLQFLEQRRIGGRPLDWRDASRPTFQAMLEYALGDPPGTAAEGALLVREKDRERLRRAVADLNALDRLVDLRHRTIVGHDFQGVSEEAVREATPGGRPPEFLAGILSKLQIDVRRDPYAVVVEFLRAQLASR